MIQKYNTNEKNNLKSILVTLAQTYTHSRLVESISIHNIRVDKKCVAIALTVFRYNVHSLHSMVHVATLTGYIVSQSKYRVAQKECNTFDLKETRD